MPRTDARRAARHAQHQARRGEYRLRRKARPRAWWPWRGAILVTLVLAIALISGGLVWASRVQLPEASPLEQTTYVCAADVSAGCGPDNALASFRAEIDRQVVTFADIPPTVVSATLAAEDREFFHHGGLDPFGIARAVFRDAQGGGALQGGSTITQQYVKNAFLSQDRTLGRKLREAVLAVKLERQLSKEEILTRYLNTIYFGRGAYGVQAASFAYFGHGLGAVPAGAVAPGPSSSALALAEAAYLAGLIRSPETADASLDEPEATFRRSSVLDAMVEVGAITVADAAGAKAIPFANFVLPRTDRSGLGPIKGAETGTTYFVDAVRQWLLDHFEGDAQRVFTGGLRVYTTLDYRLQAAAYRAIYDPQAGALPDVADPAGALVAVNEAGHVVAMVGGRDFQASQVNLATGSAGGGSGRQPGSTFKPFALAAAIESGISPLSTYPAPDRVTFPGVNDGEDWTVSGGGSASGSYNLLDALAQSSNTVFAQLMVQLGADRVTELAASMGVTAELPAVPALVLGSGEVSVLDMASSYATLANRGAHVVPALVTRVEDSSGHVLYSARNEPKTVIKVATADAVTTALRGVISDGTGGRAAIDRDAAGKTGTTEDYRDAWFVGYSCTGPSSTLTAAVWMGYPGTDGQPVVGMTDVRGVANVGGGTFPAQIFAAFMTEATAGAPDCSLPTTTRFPGERRDVKTVQGGNIPAGALRTTTTPVPSTSTASVSTSSTTGGAPPSSTAPVSGAPGGSVTSSTASSPGTSTGAPSSTTAPSTPTTPVPASTNPTATTQGTPAPPTSRP